jgi:basic membrane protein A and related proteins
MWTTRRASLLALVGVLALTLAACGEAPEDDTVAEAPDDADAEPVDFRGCLVTDQGGVDDASFNETAWAGLEQAEEELGIETAVLESQSETDFEPNVQSFIDQDCDLIITVGFLLGDVTEQAATANPDQLFAIVDETYEQDYDNLRELTFATDQAAFLAGYVSAGATESGVVGTYGGINVPTVTIFMDGYLAGVEHYNAEHDADVTVEGWDGSDGLFTGNFDSLDDGRNITESLLQAGADIIMPVAGPVGQGTAAALQDFGEGLMVWVDTDGYESIPQYGDLLLTSVLKQMDVAVFDTVQAAVEDRFEGGSYVGTLENEGVDIAPFHDNEERVPDEVVAELDALREGIIAGDVSVDPADY